MPKGTKVERCFQKNKRKMGVKKAVRICQASTKQSLKTGRSTRKKKR